MRCLGFESFNLSTLIDKSLANSEHWAPISDSTQESVLNCSVCIRSSVTHGKSCNTHAAPARSTNRYKSQTFDKFVRTKSVPVKEFPQQRDIRCSEYDAARQSTCTQYGSRGPSAVLVYPRKVEPCGVCHRLRAIRVVHVTNRHLRLASPQSQASG